MARKVYLLRPNNIDPEILESATNRLNGLGLRVEATPRDGVWTDQQVWEIMTAESLLVCIGNSEGGDDYTAGKGVFSTLIDFLTKYNQFVASGKYFEFLSNPENWIIASALIKFECGSDSDNRSEIWTDWLQDLLPEAKTLERDFDSDWEEDNTIHFNNVEGLPLPIFIYTDESKFCELWSISVDSENWSSGLLLSTSSSNYNEIENQIFIELAQRRTEEKRSFDLNTTPTVVPSSRNRFLL